ncbi:hypothetical protein [Deinococcus indicus]|nr:hypothetical protein [Deinococcus indicus]
MTRQPLLQLRRLRIFVHQLRTFALTFARLVTLQLRTIARLVTL